MAKTTLLTSLGNIAADVYIGNKREQVYWSRRTRKYNLQWVSQIECVIQNWEILVGWLCWGLTSQSTIFQSYRDGAIASWVINQYFRGVKCLAQGHNTAAVGLEPRTSRSGVRHSTTEPPRSPKLREINLFVHSKSKCRCSFSIFIAVCHFEFILHKAYTIDTCTYITTRFFPNFVMLL